MAKPDKTGAKNPNWRGGVSKILHVDDILTLPKSQIDRIKEEINQSHEVMANGCWHWTGAIYTSNGRARLSRIGHGAHRVSFVIHKGKVGDKYVCHSCDNGICVNPDHLWLGTADDNSKDMVKKGRSARGDNNGSRLFPERLVRGDNHLNRIHPERVQGENNGRALLTAEQVLEIRSLYKPYINCRKPSNQGELARRYGVAKHVISNIVKGKTWRSVK